MTFGLGYGFHGSELSDSPALLVGGLVRGTRRTALVTENYVFSTDGEMLGLFSGGVRFMGERLAVDLGLVSLMGSSDFSPPFPFIGLVVNF
jgi:hypothetical protein